MMLDLRMPGVYTYEKSSLPPTVAVIPSAVPVFIGYTEKAVKDGQDLTNKPTRIKSMSEYVEWFGGPQKVKIEVNIDDRESNPRRPEVKVVASPTLYYKMYHALQLYYANGGGPCYIMSVDKYAATPDQPVSDKFSDDCFKKLTKVKDVTILVFPDGTSMESDKYKGIIEKALMHCEKMKNRVTVIDVHGGEDESNLTTNIEAFQNNMPSDLEIKKYGMAYYPYLNTGLSYDYKANEVTVRYHIKSSEQLTAIKNFDDAKRDSEAKTKAHDAAPATDQNKADLKTSMDKAIDEKTKAEKALNKAFTESDDKAPDAVAGAIEKGNIASALNTAMENYENNPSTGNQALKTAKGHFIDNVKSTLLETDGKVKNLSGASLRAIEVLNNALYNKIIEAIRNYGVIMPPSAAIAGIFVRTDATQGVWKAPANVSVFGTIKPAIDLDDDEHASLNAPDNGKAINVIRAYPGRGTLVYGGRTLACNDLEWRYVNVRRTFCFIEDTIARAMLDFVFEPNTPQTWIRVKSMITSFLNSLWKAGGLYGNTPDDAFEVIVGEPESMSVEDVLGGIMKIIIKVAVARPAEFIVLQYEHKFSLTSN